jgi:hypothetical protein
MLVTHILFWVLIAWGWREGGINGREAATFIGIYLLSAAVLLFRESLLVWHGVVTLLAVILVFKVAVPNMRVR